MGNGTDVVSGSVERTPLPAPKEEKRVEVKNSDPIFYSSRRWWTDGKRRCDSNCFQTVALISLAVLAVAMVVFGAIARAGLDGGPGAFGYDIGCDLGRGLSDALWGTGTAILSAFVLRILYDVAYRHRIEQARRDAWNKKAPPPPIEDSPSSGTSVRARVAVEDEEDDDEVRELI